MNTRMMPGCLGGRFERRQVGEEVGGRNDDGRPRAATGGGADDFASGTEKHGWTVGVHGALESRTGEVGWNGRNAARRRNHGLPRDASATLEERTLHGRWRHRRPNNQFQIRQTRLRRLELRRLHLPTSHRKIPLPLRPQARPHRHYPQRKPRSHRRTHARSSKRHRRRHRPGAG